MLDPFIVVQNGSTILLYHWLESYKIVAFGNDRRCVIRVASQLEGFALSQIGELEDERHPAGTGLAPSTALCATCMQGEELQRFNDAD